MKVSLDELSVILDLIIKELKIEGHEEVELTGDYYWYVAGDDRKDFITDKPKLCVGSLVDDWTEITNAIDRKFATVVDMERLANIMIDMAAELTKPNSDKEEKLEAYRKNPDLNDNQGKLKNAQTQEIKNAITEGRIASFEKQVANQQARLNSIIEALKQFEE